MRKKRNLLVTLALAVLGLMTAVSARAEVDQNFYIYLCIGQSNMEGQGTIEAQDLTGIDDRFLMMSAINCGDRQVGQWRKAVPPLCRCYTKLCPADYFGRTMVAALPAETRVGVINVAVAGCKIDLFDKDSYKTYIQNEVTQQWQKDMVDAYDGNPRGKLVAAAREAMKDGVVKGILLHQGESDAYSDQWLQKVKKVYNDLLTVLDLKAEDVPLIAGEVVTTAMGGSCGGANNTINRLPSVIPTAYVVSAQGLAHQGDNLHFSSAAYRELGKRYAAKALELLGAGQQKVTPPLVYNVENTGADFPAPLMPDRKDLPFIEQLTDPFLYSDGSGRALDFSDWSRRRSEIAHELWHYQLGQKPTVSPEQVEASMSGNRLTVKVTVGSKSITLSSTISYPSSGTAPFPLMIGINSNGGSLPSAVFSVGAIAHMAYTVSQVATDSQNGGDGSGPFDTLYPELAKIGCESKWAWGVSRLIDGLQQLGPEVTRIDTEHIGISGCSWAGKCALYCGVFDERIALVLPQEPGGGGIASWRVSQWLPVSVEKISNTNYTWFLSSLRDNFNGDNVSYLPYDHHELAAMICPRAVLMIGNPSMTWLADPSGYISMQAARKVWEQYGIEDRCGYTFVGHGDHCSLPQSQYPEVQAFIKRFLLGQDDVDTNITIAPQNYVDTYSADRWTQWWGTDQQPPIYLPTGDEGEQSFYMEAEQMISASNGQNFGLMLSDACSGGKYVQTTKNNTSLSQDKANWLIGTFQIKEEGDYRVYARLNCNGSYDDDSYYVAYDANTPARSNGLAAAGNAWTWMDLGSYVDSGTLAIHLTPGEHQLCIVGREDGAKIDCVKISTSRVVPDPNVLVPEESGIQSVTIRPVSSGAAYDLQGRKVSGTQQRSGIIIVDGKKQIAD